MAALTIATRVAHFAALIVLFGELVFFLYVTDRAFAAAAARRAFRVASWSVTAALLSGALWLGLEAAEMSGRGMSAALRPETLATVLERTQFGHVWALRLILGAVLSMLLVFGRHKMESRPLPLATVVIASVLLATLAWAGHAAGERGTDRVVHLSVDAAHLVAAGAWLGVLPGLAWLLGRARSPQEVEFAAVATRRFSRLGVASVSMLLLTGIANAWYTVGGWSALLDTFYGRLLLLKLALFCAMVGLAAVNRTRLTPRLAGEAGTVAARRLRRNAIAEVVLGFAVLTVVGVLGITVPAVHAHMQRAMTHDASFGRAADPRMASRTIRVEMNDQMRFIPVEIHVTRGEIVRFVPVNKGNVAHEMVLGTMEELKEHAELMKQHPDADEEDNYSGKAASVAPGESGEISWEFTKAGEFYYACLVPGHFEDGMVGRVLVTP